MDIKGDGSNWGDTLGCLMSVAGLALLLLSLVLRLFVSP